uniref:piggyBac transposable element-derived protein 4-like n=1 Tax=Styela clava TaxID=7725 RepID=UPI00193972C6|nr:piggyBac transposable element-derived protein 4-like [Styela clava]
MEGGSRSIADSTTGYIFNVKIDYGNPNLEQLPPGVTKTSNLVLQLMESHLDRGYHVFVDRLYNSVALAEELQRRKTSITGTVMANRKGLPAEIKTKLKKGEIISLRKGQLLALLWQDKRPISILSTYCNGDEVIEKQLRGSSGTIKKPTCIELYNKFMGGVDLADQYTSYYNFSRKSVKWWKKIFFWLIETSVTNSYIIYKLTRPEGRTVTLLKYRQMVIDDLLAGVRTSPKKEPKTPSPPPKKIKLANERLNGLLHIQSKEAKQRRCKVCSTKIQRRETTYICITCFDAPALHPGNCFARYHTLLDYRCN